MGETMSILQKDTDERWIPNVAVVLALVVAILWMPGMGKAEPLDTPGFATIGLGWFTGRMEGRMGFERQAGGLGTLNDFSADLGLPSQNQTFGLLFSVRPLEHHLLRLYGTMPEIYKSEHRVERQVRTHNNVYEAGTEVNSELRYATFGFGYDLDFLVGSRWFGGLHGDLRYIDFLMRIRGPGTGREDTMTLTELTPCVGAHFQTRIPVPIAQIPGLGVGGFGRITYGMTPNFLSYYDMSVGVVSSVAAFGGVWLDFKVGYQQEALAQQNINGRDLEFRRDGVMLCIQAAY